MVRMKFLSPVRTARSSSLEFANSPINAVVVSTPVLGIRGMNDLTRLKREANTEALHEEKCNDVAQGRLSVDHTLQPRC